MCSSLDIGKVKKMRRSRRRCYMKIGVLKNFAKFTPVPVFLNKVTGLRTETLIKKRLWHKCFPVNFAKFLRTPFLQNTSGGCFCQLYSSVLGIHLQRM